MKQSFKAQRLHSIAGGMKPNIHTLIHRAVKKVTKEDVVNCIRHSKEALSS